MPPGDPVAQYMRDALEQHGRLIIHRCWEGRVLCRSFASILRGRHCLRFASGQALPPIIWNGAINDGSAVDAFPRV